MENKRTEKNKFTIWDYPLLIAYLEQMAADGWMLCDCTETTLEFEQQPPQQVHFAVTFFPDYDFLDPEPPENLKRLWAFCQMYGWINVTDNASMQIFYNPEPNPVPLHTDAVVQLENFNAMMENEKIKQWKQNVWVNGVFFGILLLVFAAVAQEVSLTEFAGILRRGSPLALLMLARHLYILITDGTRWLNYSRWYKAARIAAENENIFMPPQENQVLANADTVMSVAYLGVALVLIFRNGLIGTVVFWVLVTVAFLAVYIITGNSLKKSGLSADENRRATFGIMMLAVVVFLIIIVPLLVLLNNIGLLDGMITVTTTYPA